MRFSLLIIGLCSVLPLAQAQSVLQADSAFIQAVARSDKPALEKLLDADFIWINAAGEARTKAQVLRQVPKPVIADENSAELKRYTYGHLADGQTNLGRAHVLRVWVKRGANWKAVVYQEVQSPAEPPKVTPSASAECENPCKSVPFIPQNAIEREVIAAYSRLETAAIARNSAAFGTLVGDEFVAASSNSNKLSTKRGRMDDFDHSKNGGVAPTPLVSARLFDFGDAVLMTSRHKPVQGKPLRVTRIWVKRGGNWVETLSYQTSIEPAVP